MTSRADSVRALNDKMTRDNSTLVPTDKLKEMQQRIADLERELTEQARCNGMGSEREAALMAKVERLERENEVLKYQKQRVEDWLKERVKAVAAAQATIQTMREALEEVIEFPVDYTDHATVRAALALPADRTALDAMLVEARKEQAEKDARICVAVDANSNFDRPTGLVCANAIRQASIEALHILLTGENSPPIESPAIPRSSQPRVKVVAGLVFLSDGVPHQVVYRSPGSSDWWFCRDLTKDENDLWEFYEGDIARHAVPPKDGMREFCATETIAGLPYSRRFRAESWEDAARICKGVGWMLDGEFVCEVDADKTTPQQMAEFCARRNVGEIDS